MQINGGKRKLKEKYKTREKAKGVYENKFKTEEKTKEEKQININNTQKRGKVERRLGLAFYFFFIPHYILNYLCFITEEIMWKKE